MFETWDLKINSTMLSWCIFNSDDILEAPDQTDCIHNLKVKSIRVFFDTFYQKVTRFFKSRLLFQRITYALLLWYVFNFDVTSPANYLVTSPPPHNSNLTNISWCVSDFNVRPTALGRNQIENTTWNMVKEKLDTYFIYVDCAWNLQNLIQFLTCNLPPQMRGWQSNVNTQHEERRLIEICPQAQGS